MKSICEHQVFNTYHRFLRTHLDLDEAVLTPKHRFHCRSDPAVFVESSWNVKLHLILKLLIVFFPLDCPIHLISFLVLAESCVTSASYCPNNVSQWGWCLGHNVQFCSLLTLRHRVWCRIPNNPKPHCQRVPQRRSSLEAGSAAARREHKPHSCRTVRTRGICSWTPSDWGMMCCYFMLSDILYSSDVLILYISSQTLVRLMNLIKKKICIFLITSIS